MPAQEVAILRPVDDRRQVAAVVEDQVRPLAVREALDVCSMHQS